MGQSCPAISCIVTLARPRVLRRVARERVSHGMHEAGGLGPGAYTVHKDGTWSSRSAIVCSVTSV